MMAPVTTPRWSHATVDCGPTTVHTDSKPSPKPSTNVLVTGIHTGGWFGGEQEGRDANQANPLPITAVSRKPIRRKKRADCEDASGQPRLMLARTAPAATAPSPSTSCP